MFYCLKFEHILTCVDPFRRSIFEIYWILMCHCLFLDRLTTKHKPQSIMPEYMNELTLEENLKAESEILKLKIELDGSSVYEISDASVSSAESEYMWLHRLYEYEKIYKKSGVSKIYDFVGRPSFKALNELGATDVEPALLELLEVMRQKGIELTWDEDSYKANSIYQFIIDELFPFEVSHSMGNREGDVWMFCYEDFHPNHKNDLHRYATEYLNALFAAEQWNPDMLICPHMEYFLLNGNTKGYKRYCLAVQKFKTLFKGLFCGWVVDQINYDLSMAEAKISCKALVNHLDVEFFEIHFKLNNESWMFSGIDWPLLELH